MKSVLLVSYWYPPAVGAAARRVAGFAGRLSEHGWRPIVVTAGDPESDSLERAASDGVHSGSVASTISFESADSHAVRVIRIVDPFAGAATVMPDYQWPVEQARRRTGLPRGWLMPDRFTFWQRRVARRLKSILRGDGDSKPDVVWATFPPASAARLGLRLANRLKRPLVADLRDLWLGAGGYDPPTGWHRRKHERLARDVIGGAAHVVVVSTAMRDHVATTYAIDPHRITVIPNGYESAVCPAIAPATVSRAAGGATGSAATPFVLAHVGSVIPRNRPELFFDAVASHGAPLAASGLRIRFVGNLSRETAARPEFGGLVETSGLVPHDVAWREMASADALMLLVGDYVGRWGHNAKVFEYLLTGRPILCLEESAGSNDRKLLESLDAARCVFADLNSAEGVLRGIEAIRGKAREFLTDERVAAARGMEAYSRAALSERLARVLNDVTANYLHEGQRCSSPEP